MGWVRLDDQVIAAGLPGPHWGRRLVAYPPSYRAWRSFDARQMSAARFGQQQLFRRCCQTPACPVRSRQQDWPPSRSPALDRNYDPGTRTGSCISTSMTIQACFTPGCAGNTGRRPRQQYVFDSAPHSPFPDLPSLPRTFVSAAWPPHPGSAGRKLTRHHSCLATSSLLLPVLSAPASVRFAS